MGISMETNTNPLVKFFILFIPAFILCIIFSFFYYEPQVSVFDLRSSVLQFIIGGTLGALFFACLETVSLRTALIIFILLSLFGQPYISLPADLSLYIRKILFNAAIGASIYSYRRYSSSDKKVFWNKPLQLAGYLGLAYLIVDGLWYFIYRGGFSSAITGFLTRGFISGLALGIGFEIGKYILNKMNKTSEADSEELLTEK
jgi:hypothetical protein